jgi:hypothetical protein
MTYKGYKINLRPYKIGVGVKLTGTWYWNLEIEKNNFAIGTSRRQSNDFKRY